jgi:hypothetical protein
MKIFVMIISLLILTACQPSIEENTSVNIFCKEHKYIFSKFPNGQVIASGQPMKTSDLLNQKTDEKGNIVAQTMSFESKYVINNPNLVNDEILIKNTIKKFNTEIIVEIKNIYNSGEEIIPESTCKILG